jgi:hypothetical protein
MVNLLYTLYDKRARKPVEIILSNKGRRMMVGVNLNKIHRWKCHNETPLYNEHTLIEMLNIS